MVGVFKAVAVGLAASPLVVAAQMYAGMADYSKPLYAKDDAVVCPIAVLLEERRGFRLADAISEAKGSIPSLKRKMLDMGCTERLAGNRLHVDPDDVDNPLQRVRFNRQLTTEEWLIMSYDVRN